MSKLKELKEKRAAIHAEATGLLKAEQTPETRQKIDAIFADIDLLGKDIERIERADKITAELAAASTEGGEHRSEEEIERDNKKSAKSYRNAWGEYMCRGFADKPRSAIKGGVSDKNFRLLVDTKNKVENAVNVEQRDQIAGTQSITYTQGAAGGFFVPAGFVYDVEIATRYYAPLLDGTTIRIMDTATGQVLPYPTSNDTNEAWQIVGESAQVTDQGTATNAVYSSSGVLSMGSSQQAGNVSIGSISFGAFKGSTGLIRVSLELLQDSAFNIENFLTDAFAVRLGRGYEFYLTQGTGVNQPLGIVPAILASGVTPTVAQGSSSNDGSSNTGANSIGYIDLVNLIHSIDPTYRRGAKFMFHDGTLRFLRTLLDKFGRPLWVPGVKDSEPDTIAGYPYVINQAFDNIAASKNTVAFGSWQKFICRRVRDLQVLRLDERFADFGEVAYIAFSRIDSRLVDAGTHPLNLLQQHS